MIYAWWAQLMKSLNDHLRLLTALWPKVISTNQRLTSIAIHKAAAWWKLNAVGEQQTRLKGSLFDILVFFRNRHPHLRVCKQGGVEVVCKFCSCFIHGLPQSVPTGQPLIHFICICISFFNLTSHSWCSTHCRKYSTIVNVCCLIFLLANFSDYIHSHVAHCLHSLHHKQQMNHRLIYFNDKTHFHTWCSVCGLIWTLLNFCKTKKWCSTATILFLYLWPNPICNLTIFYDWQLLVPRFMFRLNKSDVVLTYCMNLFI